MIVIGCGKAKLDRKVPARELYTGSLFVAARRYAEAKGGPWAVLSAEHGLVLPTEELAPYERKLRLKGGLLRHWAMRAATRCVHILSETNGESVVEVLAGHPYAWPFRNELHWMGVKSTEPLEGLGLGLRLQWLSRELATARGKEKTP